MDERPPISPSKLLNQFNDWVGETELPGRTMAYLKTGMLQDLFAEHGGDSAQHLVEAWTNWEKGKVGPTPTLEALRDHGVVDLLTALSA